MFSGLCYLCGQVRLHSQDFTEKSVSGYKFAEINKMSRAGFKPWQQQVHVNNVRFTLTFSEKSSKNRYKN
jgi:hypothetical protein